MKTADLKIHIATEVAKLLMDEYGWRYDKCFSMAVMSKWFSENQTYEELENTDIHDVYGSVKQQIDNNEIL